MDSAQMNNLILLLKKLTSWNNSFRELSQKMRSAFLRQQNYLNCL